jgi:peptide/nickel transport system ATP-binding protein
MIRPDLPLLEVRGLELSLGPPQARVEILKGIDFDLWPGEMLGLVGSSGAGKSLATLCILGLLPAGAERRGSIRLAGAGELGGKAAPWSAVRGSTISIVVQDPAAALDPLLRVGSFFVESARSRGIGAAAARKRGEGLLEKMALPDPDRLWRAYPHELSGGQRQRLLLALALFHSPRILIADEPTTALDVTVQAQIFGLLRRLVREEGLAILLVTHDLALVAENCNRMVLLEDGRSVEQGRVEEIFAAPRHPATRRLMAAAGVAAAS